MNGQTIFKEQLKNIKTYLGIARCLQRIVPTIDGVKPAEILTICENQFNSIYNKYFKENKSIDMITIKQRGEKRQVIVYHRECLKAILKQKGVQFLLKSKGYPIDSTVECNVGYLVRRIKNEPFPHEIGVFLGYPLKDVFGYMRLNTLPHTKTMGWCMYGNTRESERIYAKYCAARECKEIS